MTSVYFNYGSMNKTEESEFFCYHIVEKSSVAFAFKCSMLKRGIENFACF